MAESDNHLQTLNNNRYKIVKHLQVERSFLFDYLLSKNVFDRDDYDMVRAEKTREQKAAKVLDIMETKGPEGFGHFKDALQLVNPNLYEAITGEKATTRENPILNTIDFLDSGEGLPRLIDQDILSNHLRRVTDDLRDMTLRYNTLLKEDQQLRKSLQQSQRDNATLTNRLGALEILLAETEADASKTYSDANFSLINQYEAMQQVKNGNKDFIIQLQMKLLESQEKYEEKNRKLEDYISKYKNLQDELLKVNENYTFQRSETKKLSATLKTRTEEAKYCDQMKKQCREKQFKIMELQSDLDEREKELDKIKSWTTALKQRYDTVLKERNEIMAKQHEAIENLSLSQNNVTDMDIKVKRLNRELMELRKDRDKLESEAAMLKSQVKSEHNAYVKATDKLEELKAYFNELIECKERELSENKEFVEFLQEEVKDLKRELTVVKTELSTALNTNDSLSCEIRKVKTEYELTLQSLELQITEDEKNEENIDEKETTSEDSSNVSKDVVDSTSCTKRKIRRNSTAELLKSIRRRFFKSPSQSSFPQEKKEYHKSQSAVDDYCSHTSSGTRSLPYDALSFMYTSDTDTDHSLLSSSCLTRSTLPNFCSKDRRKISSPFPLSSCDSQSILYLKSISVQERVKEEILSDKDVERIKKENGSSQDDSKIGTPFRPRSQAVRRQSQITSTE